LEGGLATLGGFASDVQPATPHPPNLLIS